MAIFHTSFLTRHSTIEYATYGKLFMYIQIGQILLTLLINFVPVYKHRSCLNRILIFSHVVTIVSAFILIPLVSICLYIYALLTEHIWHTNVGIWMLTYSLTSACMILLFPFLIKPSIDESIAINKENRFKDAENVDIEPYVTRFRDIGDGQLRLGTSFHFREDMYSLLFIGQVKPEYYEQC